MAANDVTFLLLPQLQFQCYHHCAKPVYHPTKVDCIIVSTDFEDGNAGIWLFDLSSNKTEIIKKYDHEFRPEKYAQFVDKAKNMLYIVGGVHSSFGKLDLESMQIHYDQDNGCDKVAECGRYAKVAYVPPMDGFYIWSRSTHFVSSHMNGECTFKEASNNSMECNIAYPKLLYNMLTQQILIFGSSSNDAIWICDIKQDMIYMNYEWKISDMIKMPLCTYDDDYDIVSFDNVILVFYFATSGHTDIFCLSLLNNKWYKSEYKTPNDIESEWNIFVFKSLNNDIHLLDLKGKAHFKVALHDLIPMELKQSHLKYYQPLIMGYIKQMEHENIASGIPFDIQRLILLYFPLFA